MQLLATHFLGSLVHSAKIAGRPSIMLWQNLNTEQKGPDTLSVEQVSHQSKQTATRMTCLG